jgi:hypothetical protein
MPNAKDQSLLSRNRVVVFHYVLKVHCMFKDIITLRQTPEINTHHTQVMRFARFIDFFFFLSVDLLINTYALLSSVHHNFYVIKANIILHEHDRRVYIDLCIPC